MSDARRRAAKGLALKAGSALFAVLAIRMTCIAQSKDLPSGGLLAENISKFWTTSDSKREHRTRDAVRRSDNMPSGMRLLTACPVF